MLERFERLPRVARVVVIMVIISALGVVDYFTGFELSFAFFYLLPVGLAAWSLALPLAIATSVASAATWLVANEMAGDPVAGSIILYWNATTRLGFFVVVSVLLSRLRLALERERTLSRTDFLTGTLNSRAFREHLTGELERARRYGRPFTLLYLDLDNFKTVNDSFGHTTGDELLQVVAAAMRSALRRTDTTARLGGDEFAVLLPETDADAARRAAEAVRTSVRDAMQRHEWPVSASIGALTCLSPPDTADALITRVDQLMYEAKRGTKDTVAYAVVQASGDPGHSRSAPRALPY